MSATAEPPDGIESDESEERQRARSICLTQLGRAARTRAQLAGTLRRRGISDEVANAVLDRFTEVGLIDDEVYASSFVRSRQQERGLARRALRYELNRRGVEDETIQVALESVDDEQERETARRMVVARLPASRGEAPQRRARRLIGMLARKGYSPGVAVGVVRDALAAEESERPDIRLEMTLDALAESLDEANDV